MDTTTTHFDIAVIGAGILGSSVAAHLAEGGARSVALVEAASPGRGTSDAGAGFVGTWAAGYMPSVGEPEVELERYGLSFYRELGEQADFGLRNCGSLFAAVTEEGVDRIRSIAAHPLAPEGTRLLSPAEAADLTGGLLDPDRVTAAALHPSGIQISAGDAVRALVARAVAAGVSLLERTRVVSIETDSASGGFVLVTADARIRAGRVVLACGAWINELLEPLGAAVPLAREIASRVVSPPSGVPEGIPTLMVPEWSLWLREERGGLTWANTDSYAPLTEFAPRIELGERPVFPELLDRMDEPLLPQLQRLIPNHDLSVQSWLQGLPCYTPDGLFLAGELGGFEGLYVLGGDNEAGVTHGPGLGRLLAGHMLGISSFPFDIGRYSPSRFGEGAWTEADVFESLPDYE